MAIQAIHLCHFLLPGPASRDSVWIIVLGGADLFLLLPFCPAGRGHGRSSSFPDPESVPQFPIYSKKIRNGMQSR